MTVSKRVIACLDVKDGKVVKGINFENLVQIGDPVVLAETYAQAGVDELVFLDVAASEENRKTMIEVVERTAENVFVPLCVGGGISSVSDVLMLLKAGCDKVSVNTSAVKNPFLISQIAEKFGSQVITLSIDAKKGSSESGYVITTHGGKKTLELDAIKWIQQAVELGAGEILLNSIDADGTKNGFDLEMLRKVREICPVPLIASGGAGQVSDFAPAIGAGADAVLAASVFHSGQVTVSEVKKDLALNQIPVRYNPQAD
jgi:imidazole glycerol-phosphate synthase subunit HisF